MVLTEGPSEEFDPGRLGLSGAAKVAQGGNTGARRTGVQQVRRRAAGGVAIAAEMLPKRAVIEVLLVVVHTSHRVTYNPTLSVDAGSKGHPIGTRLGKDVESVHFAARRYCLITAPIHRS